MNLRNTETRVARFTLGFLIVYFPIETWASWNHGLWNPFYLVDLIAMVLLLWGAVHSLHARPRSAPALLCAAYGWTAANAWRATFGRVFEVAQGGQLEHGACELWVVGISTALMLGCFALLLYFVVRASTTGAEVQ